MPFSQSHFAGSALDRITSFNAHIGERLAGPFAGASLIQTDAARRAWRRYGKGRHPAALNCGDCFAYALALIRGEPLLFKGDDFARTDINHRGEGPAG